MADYKVQFEVFEGPLDLLLYLVKKEEVDIYRVNLTHLATQFIEYVELMRQLDLDVAGEFLVMASTLMWIKSRELLPVDQQTSVEGEEEGDDPRWELIRKLVEYKKFKDAAVQLQSLETRQEATFSRQPVKPAFEAPPVRTEASLFDLVSAVSSILQRFRQRDDARDLFEDRWTVTEKIEQIRAVLSSRSPVSFSELFGPATSRSEVVATFLALLELIRLRQIMAIQAETFGEIRLERTAVVAEAGSHSAESAGSAAPVAESGDRNNPGTDPVAAPVSNKA